MLRPLARIAFAIATVFLAGAGSGCHTDPDSDEESIDEDLTQTISALSGDFTDASGAITVRIKQCSWSASMAYPSTTCSIESDFVLVGGGSEVEGNAAPGALLTASYPNSSLTTWMASSKDHASSYPHRLRAYAVGLKLSGVAVSTLRNYMYLAVSDPAYGQHSSATAELPPGFKLVGGGAQAIWSTYGQLLVSSYPDGIQWVAEAKDHIYGEVGAVKAFAIGIASSIPGFGSIETYHSSNPTWAASGYGTATIPALTGWVLTSIGGDAHYNGYGRLLTDLVPFYDTIFTRPGARSISKDHVYYDSGYTTAYIISIRRP